MAGAIRAARFSYGPLGAPGSLPLDGPRTSPRERGFVHGFGRPWTPRAWLGRNQPAVLGGPAAAAMDAAVNPAPHGARRSGLRGGPGPRPRDGQNGWRFARAPVHTVAVFSPVFPERPPSRSRWGRSPIRTGTGPKLVELAARSCNRVGPAVLRCLVFATAHEDRGLAWRGDPGEVGAGASPGKTAHGTGGPFRRSRLPVPLPSGRRFFRGSSKAPGTTLDRLGRRRNGRGGRPCSNARGTASPPNPSSPRAPRRGDSDSTLGHRGPVPDPSSKPPRVGMCPSTIDNRPRRACRHYNRAHRQGLFSTAGRARGLYQNALGPDDLSGFSRGGGCPRPLTVRTPGT